MRAKKCNRCAKPAVSGKRLCEDHLKTPVYVPEKRKYVRKPSKKKRQYIHPLKNDRRWHKLSRAFLQNNPLCSRCSIQNRKVAAEHCDHIKPLRYFPELAFDQSNFQSLCRRCHSIKTVAEQNGTFHDYVRKRAYKIEKTQL